MILAKSQKCEEYLLDCQGARSSISARVDYTVVSSSSYSCGQSGYTVWISCFSCGIIILGIIINTGIFDYQQKIQKIIGNVMRGLYKLISYFTGRHMQSGPPHRESELTTRSLAPAAEPNPPPADALPGPPAPPKESDSVSMTSSRRHYMYDEPARTKADQDTLNSYLLVAPDSQENKTNSPRCLEAMNFKSFRAHAFYFVAMLNLEVCLCMFYLVAMVAPSSSAKKYGFNSIIIYLSLCFAVWGFYISFKRDFISQNWGVFWLECSVSLLGAGIGGMTETWIVPLAFSTSAVSFGSYMRHRVTNKGKNWQNFLIGMVLWATLWLVSMLLALVTMQNRTLDLSFTANIAFFILMLFVLCYALYDLCMRPWHSRTALLRWQFFSWIYGLVFGICFGVSISLNGSLNGQHLWIYITQATNFVFLLNLFYYIFYVAELKCWRVNPLIRFRAWLQSIRDYNSNLLYPMAEGLLTTDIHYYNNPRKSIMGKPLANCTVCLSEQSRFYYENCKHTCVGHSCIIMWLKNGERRCPLCRERSDILVEVRRVRDMQFEAQKRYVFK